MQNDTRDKNETFDQRSPHQYLAGYAEKLKWGLSQIVDHELADIITLLQRTRANGRRIFVAGNGGSAAIAEHLECDFRKGTECMSWPNLQTISLASNVPVLTAIGNDISFDEIFSYQLRLQSFRADEVLILISSSGNSPNIIKAAEYAIHKKGVVIGLSGFQGGKLQALADFSLHVPVSNYGVVEDAHQALMHTIAQYLYLTSKSL